MDTAAPSSLKAKRELEKREMEHAEKAKEREFYRYYHHSQRPKIGDYNASPIKQASASPTKDTAVIERPSPAHDKALTAFAQLGALRLGTRRCLISFFDRRNCYILAEATPTLSLQTGQAQSDGDELCWGTCVFPRNQSICFYTVNRGDLVVNDLRVDDRFKNYPSVTGPAQVRYYAGVPIQGPSGNNIGTYCVLDDKPRSGAISELDMGFLREMGITVMRHLEMTRAADDHRRSGIMVRSLGSFAEGKSTLEDWWQESWEAEAGSSSGQRDDIPVPRQRRRTTSGGGASLREIHDPFVVEKVDSFGSTTPSTKTPNLTTPESGTPGSSVITPASGLLDDQHRSAAPTGTTSSTDVDKSKLSPELKAIFSRAAKMMREATEADGAVFFDAQVSTFGGLVDDEFVQENADLLEQDKQCVVLGASSTTVARPAATSVQRPLYEAGLRHLLRNYSHGQIFNFDDDTVWTTPPSSNDKNSIPVLSQTHIPVPADALTETLQLFGSTLKRPDSSRSLDDENLLREVFPHARSLVLYPLWDAHRDRWFAGLVIWSSDPMRVFTIEQELSYLAAFSNSLMAEVARLDTKLADAAKGDFISSISHELRSPLHGILGCCELLKDTDMDNFQTNMSQTIETCGKTLLDTINHVLDFAKINSLTRGSSKQKKKRSQSTKHIISPAESHTNDIMTIISDVDLSILTEEVLETVFAGYNFQKTATSQMFETPSRQSEAPSIAVIVDINKSDNYIFRTQPGAWRRVLMNLFGNALKYTPAGYTKVKLQVVPGTGPRGDMTELRLIVIDSGIGMSEGYVNNRLFHSFAQENPLSQGTGLGLSIVKQIVESLGGDIEVRSQKEHGTKFTVSVPLKPAMSSPADSLANQDKELPQVQKRTFGMNVTFVGFDEEGDYLSAKSRKNKQATVLTRKAISNLCTDWFGMNVQSHGDAHAKPADLFVATESGAQLLRAQPNKDSQAPVIVVCQGPGSAHKMNALITSRVYECIAQPCGPHKFAKALASCLNRHASRLEVQSTLPDIGGLNMKENTTPLGSPADVGPILSYPRPVHNHPLDDIVRPRLPSALSAPEVRPLSVSPTKATRPTPRAINCLAADDNPINLRLLRTFIEKLHHKHGLATNGLEAVARFKEAAAGLHGLRPFDVVLMDINMPEMDGLEATRQIRAHERDAGLNPVTIIALTGVASSEAQQEAHVSGVNLFLIKPVRLGELETVLNGVVMAS